MQETVTLEIKEKIPFAKKVIEEYKKKRWGLIFLNFFGFILLFFSLISYTLTYFPWWSYVFLGINSLLLSQSIVSFFEYRKTIKLVEKWLFLSEKYLQQKENEK